MFEFLKPLSRGVGALGVLIGASVLPMVSHAGAPVDDSASIAAPAGGESQVVARDLVTGKLRPATAEEVQVLRSHRAELRAAGSLGTQSRSHWSGAVGARLTEEFLSYSVVVKQADGRLVEICVEGSEAATKAINSPATSKTAGLPTE
jgi:hypothetical protein